MHWYHYPVHYFLATQYVLYDTFKTSVFNLMIVNFSNNFKYDSVLNYLKYPGNSSYGLFIDFLLFKYKSFSNINYLNINPRINMQSTSYFFDGFSSIYINYFFSFGSSSFYVNLSHKFLDFNFFNSLFLFRNNEFLSNRKSLTMNFFFFNVPFLRNLYSLSHDVYLQNNFTNKLFVSDFENFNNLLVQNSKNNDGSGRLNRPRGFSQSLDHIFTYREFEKYRIEHHRQRFRSISPHWIQNSLKNRVNFRFFYSSPDKLAKLRARRELISMFYNSKNSKLQPQFYNRKSYIDPWGDDVIFHKLLKGKNLLPHQHHFKNNFFYNQKLKNLNNISKQQKLATIKREAILLNLSLKEPSIEARKGSSSEKLLTNSLTSSTNSDIDSIEAAEENISADLRENEDLESFLTKQEFLKEEKISNSYKLFSRDIKQNSKSRLKKLKNELQKLNSSSSFLTPLIEFSELFRYSDTQTSIFYNRHTPFIFSKMFPVSSSIRLQANELNDLAEKNSDESFLRAREFVSSARTKDSGSEISKYSNKFYFKNNLNKKQSNNYESGNLSLSDKENLYNNRRFFSPLSSILMDHSEDERSISPLFMKSYRTADFNSIKDGVGGLDSHKLINKRKYPLTHFYGRETNKKISNEHILDYDFPKEKRNKNNKTKTVGYSSNIKKFLRPYNKVLMHIPFLYSKWFTQNPRLNFAIDNDFLNIFINNQYDELNYICVQSLLLLKRKIMYNIINLKLITSKSKILYFTNLNTFNNDSVTSFFRLKILKEILLFSRNLYQFSSLYNFSNFLNYVNDLRNWSLESFFDNNFLYIRLFLNTHIEKFRHDSVISSDLLFSEEFYYNIAAKRILSQISLSNANTGGWYNPIGLFGQYIPALNFYTNSKFPLNFLYQYPDFFSGRSFSPEIYTLNNLSRQNTSLFDREFFYNQFPIDSNYQPSWRFINIRIASPPSPFFEYELPHFLIFSRSINQKHRRLPLFSFRRINDLYPNHLSSFFSTMNLESNSLIGHDITLPYKIKLLNFKLKQNVFYRRLLENSFQNSVQKVSHYLEIFPIGLKLKQLSILAHINNRINFSSLVNKRRFSIRSFVWSPIRYNYYYYFNWRNFLHKTSSNDIIGFRKYKLNPFFDLYQGDLPYTIKNKAFQQLSSFQIPRLELDSRRRVPTLLSLKDFSLMFLTYFKYVNSNFLDKGYYNQEKKIFKYTNRKLHPYLDSFWFQKNENYIPFQLLGVNKQKYPLERWMSKVVISQNFHNLEKFSKPIYFSIPKKKSSGFQRLKFASFDKFPFVLLKKLNKDVSNYFYFWFGSSPFFVRYLPYQFSTDFKKNLIKSVSFIFRKLEAYRRKTYHGYWNFLFDFFKYKQNTSRIFGIDYIYRIKKQKELSLNPVSWLSFDLFSRVRPSFKPFSSKIIRKFSFSKLIPEKGLASFNFFIKSHTLYDNFFEQHPYISFSIGNFKENPLVFSESSYKEIKKRSYMLDFSKRLLSFRNSPNHSLHPRFRSDRSTVLSHNLFSKDNNNYVSSYYFPESSSISVGNRGMVLNRKGLIQKFFKRKFNSIPHNFFLLDSYKGDGKSSTRSKLFGDFEPLFKDLLSFRNHNQARKRFNYKYNNFYKNSSYFAVMSNPKRKGLLFNQYLVRPYNIFFNIIRKDNFSIFRNNMFGKIFFSTINFFNFDNNLRFRSYYQPNFKIFFDFNAYKQRYNLSLLFRDLSFERDVQLFLFQKKNFLINFNSSFISKTDSSLLSEFTSLSVLDYFRFLIPENIFIKGFLIDSKFNNIVSFFEKFYFKIEIHYLLLVVFDLIVIFAFNFYSLIHQLNFFDFSFFLNIFNFDETFIYYNRNRTTFQIFFHLSLFREYLKFSWLFSLKFLIFNIDYYPYYFFVFSFLLIARRIGLNLQRRNKNSLFVVPYISRFSDLHLNSYNGWFDSAWEEIKAEALNRLHIMQSSNILNISYETPLNPKDLESMKRAYKVSKNQSLFDINEKEMKDEEYQNKSIFDRYFGSPVGVWNLKGILSKIGSLGFFFPSYSLNNSDKLKNEDNFFENKRFETPDALNLEKIENSALKKAKPFSFFLLKKNVSLFFKRKITFSDFFKSLNFGKIKSSSSRNEYIYTLDDFGNEFGKLFLSKEAELNFFVNNNLYKKRMLPQDENIHFYRKSGSLLFNEMLSKEQGTESDQFYYIMEFPGKFNNNYINTFSRLYAIRNLNYNYPQYGYLSVPKNVKIPTTFEEFLTFCSIDPVSLKIHETTNPVYGINLDVEQLRVLWSLFQYVTKYEYNMFSVYDSEDVNLLKKQIFFPNRYSILENFKFWVNKASVDATDLNIFNSNLYLSQYFSNPFYFQNKNNGELTDNQLDIRSEQYDPDLNISSEYNSRVVLGRFSLFMFSYLYIFYIYIFLFIYFLFLTLIFCLFFLFLISLFNYINFFLI